MNNNNIAITIGRIASLALVMLVYPMVKQGHYGIAGFSVILFVYWWGVRQINE